MTAHAHNCTRCGKDFLHYRGERVCGSCRVPKAKASNTKLTFRQQQVVALVAQAKLNKEIAYELHLTEDTIKQYLNRIFHKLKLRNRTELATWYIGQLPS